MSRLGIDARPAAAPDWQRSAQAAAGGGKSAPALARPPFSPKQPPRPVLSAPPAARTCGAAAEASPHSHQRHRGGCAQRQRRQGVAGADPEGPRRGGALEGAGAWGRGCDVPCLARPKQACGSATLEAAACASPPDNSSAGAPPLCPPVLPCIPSHRRRRAGSFTRSPASGGRRRPAWRSAASSAQSSRKCWAGSCGAARAASEAAPRAAAGPGACAGLPSCCRCTASAPTCPTAAALPHAC